MATRNSCGGEKQGEKKKSQKEFTFFPSNYPYDRINWHPQGCMVKGKETLQVEDCPESLIVLRNLHFPYIKFPLVYKKPRILAQIL